MGKVIKVDFSKKKDVEHSEDDRLDYVLEMSIIQNFDELVEREILEKLGEEKTKDSLLSAAIGITLSLQRHLGGVEDDEEWQSAREMLKEVISGEANLEIIDEG